MLRDDLYVLSAFSKFRIITLNLTSVIAVEYPVPIS